MLPWVIIQYDLDEFPFPAIVARHVGSELSRLHERYQLERLAYGTEQQTPLHELLYSIGEPFFETYARFLRRVVRPLIGDDVIYQMRPNFRVQLPGNIAVRGFHRDRDDNHLKTEINCWLPLTPVSDTTAVWIESWEGAGDHRPAVVQPGELLVFDGSNLEHGNRESTSATTRVSFDFRVVPGSVFQPSNARSVYLGVRFQLGEYFARLEPDGAPAAPTPIDHPVPGDGRSARRR